MPTLTKSSLRVESEAIVLEATEEGFWEKEGKKAVPKTPLKKIGEAVEKYGINTSRIVLLPKICDPMWGKNAILIDPWKNLGDQGLWTAEGFFRTETSRFGFDYGQVVFPGKSGVYLWLQGADSEYQAKRKIIVMIDSDLLVREVGVTERILENVWGRIFHYGKVDAKRRVEQGRKNGLRFDRS